MPIANIARPVVARPVNNNLPAINALAPRQATAIDSFQPAAPVAQPLAPQAAISQPAAATSSSGGFFSGLWSRLKSVFSGILGQLGQVATQAASSFLGGLVSKATSWLGGLFTSAQNKLTQ
jgi:hypothetical protein